VKINVICGMKTKKTNYKLSFKERSKLALEQLSKQKPVTLDEARKQVLWLKEISKNKQK